MNRRSFLHQTAATAAAALAAGPALHAAPAAEAKASGIIDCNISIGHWPFRYYRGQESSEILTQCRLLREKGLTRGWAGSIEGIFYRDVTQANDILHERCTEYGREHGGARLLLPAFTINPTLPSWENDFSQCVSVALTTERVIRLHPNYHGYTLDDPLFLKLLEAATEAGFLVQVVVQMEDERTQHPLMQVKPVNLKPLPAILKKVPNARVMVLNANRAMSMTALQDCPVWLDFAMLEGVAGIEALLKDWPLEKLVFGSHAPLFYWESAKLKLQESELSEKQLAAITHDNAARCLQS
ncbi:amidohydrolase family protein [Roseimicrobium sp. ORNL1]|uniref:amidohydrolase family protein n=1 Tax=Roseimicrobium sp. ORNL1 TaxID=2711231 RepID=UPI0013E188D1|nr:amidohydrolase family protein [Roseimicrobium sp. ORNL1]QIF01058.1 amidohydrolase family protein [Roseimicrobium sp. ORNL1]